MHELCARSSYKSATKQSTGIIIICSLYFHSGYFSAFQIAHHGLILSVIFLLFTSFPFFWILKHNSPLKPPFSDTKSAMVIFFENSLCLLEVRSIMFDSPMTYLLIDAHEADHYNDHCINTLTSLYVGIPRALCVTDLIQYICIFSQTICTDVDHLLWLPLLLQWWANLFNIMQNHLFFIITCRHSAQWFLYEY